MVIWAGLAWLAFALPVAALLGQSIRMRDEACGAPINTDSVERYLAQQAPTPLP